MPEDKIVSLLKRKFNYKEIPAGIGDDCAVLPYTKSEYLLFATDTILDTVHFKLNEVSPYYIGYKAIAVNISDIAAMGGAPLYAGINLGLPGYDLELVNEIYRGIQKISKRFNLKVVTGDTVKSEVLFLAVAIIGRVEKKYLVKRSGARVGDFIYITGNIGGAVSSGKHYKFTPRLEEARWLVKNYKISSMIDISDGLLIDLYRICKESKKGAILDKKMIPISKGLNFKQAIREGEDFELLFTSRSKMPQNILHLNIKITKIGEIIKEGIYLKQKDKLQKLKISGYDHFK